MAVGDFFSTVASFLPKAIAAPQLSFMDQVKMQAPGSSPGFVRPVIYAIRLLGGPHAAR